MVEKPMLVVNVHTFGLPQSNR